MTTVEGLTHLADCPTCGRPRWVLVLCECGCPVVNHQLGTKAGATVRTECLTGGCSCRRYAEPITASTPNQTDDGEA